MRHLQTIRRDIPGVRTIVDPATGRRYPIPAGGADDDGDGGTDGSDDGGDSDDGSDGADDDGSADDGGDGEDDDPEGADQLGDAGKKALDRMKGERNAVRDELRPWKALADELDLTPDKVRQLVEDADGETPDVDKIRRQAREEATRTLGQAAVRAEVKAQATGRLADPADATAFLDLTKFDVTDDGDVDEQAITKAIDDLLERKPHLAAQGGDRWQGGSDGGPRKDPPKPEPKPGLDRLRHAYQSD